MEFVADCYKMKMFHISSSLQFSSLVVRQVYFQLVSRSSIIFMNFCFNSRIKALNFLWRLALINLSQLFAKLRCGYQDIINFELAFNVLLIST
jgi:hypothetical protein